MGLPSRFTAPFTRFLSSFSLARPAFLALVPRLFLFFLFPNIQKRRQYQEKEGGDAEEKRVAPKSRRGGVDPLAPFSYPTRGSAQKAVNYDLRRHRTLSRTLFGVHRSSSRRENAGGSAYLPRRSAQWKLRYVCARAEERERTLYFFSVSHGMLHERKRE